MAMQLASFWGVIVPLAYWLGHGVPGLLAAMVAGFALASLLLGLRFRALAGRAVRPV